MRRLHRILSVVFTVFVLGNFAAMAIGNEQLGMAVGGLTLVPLVLLLLTGSYLFALPYLRGRASAGTPE
jgi:hypothetical protein